MSESGKFTITLVFDVIGGSIEDSPSLATGIADAIEIHYNMVGITSENEISTITAVAIYTEDGYTTLRELN